MRLIRKLWAKVQQKRWIADMDLMGISKKKQLGSLMAKMNRDGYEKDDNRMAYSIHEVTALP